MRALDLEALSAMVSERIYSAARHGGPRLPLDDWQDYVRWSCLIMKDSVDRLDEIVWTILGDRPSSVGVAVESRKVAAGDLQPDPMARLEEICGCPEIDP